MQSRRYSPDPALKNPRLFFRDMIRDAGRSSGLAYQIALRDFKALYRQSALGYFWAFLPPLVTTALFLFLRSGKAFSTEQDVIPYLPFILIGTLMWQTFADAVQGPLKVVSASKQMIIKINFPQEALLLAGVGLTVINFTIRLTILIPALVYFYFAYPEMSLTANTVFFPLSVLALMLIGYAIGVLIAPLGMLFKDVNMALMLFLTFWMFVTPVVFPLASEGKVAFLQILNPVTPVLVTAREFALGLPPTMLGHAILVLVAFCFLLLCGWTIFRVALPHVIARLGM
ncbi:MAG: ABC transporter permease [Puniceicoccaceae bacterium]